MVGAEGDIRSPWASSTFIQWHLKSCETNPKTSRIPQKSKKRLFCSMDPLICVGVCVCVCVLQTFPETSPEGFPQDRSLRLWETRFQAIGFQKTGFRIWFFWLSTKWQVFGVSQKHEIPKPWNPGHIQKSRNHENEGFSVSPRSKSPISKSNMKI